MRRPKKLSAAAKERQKERQRIIQAHWCRIGQLVKFLQLVGTTWMTCDTNESRARHIRDVVDEYNAALSRRRRGIYW